MRPSIIVFLLYIVPIHIFAQCSTTISTFPYTENFETSDGGWVTGGFLSGWTWGTPNKATIKTAAGGTKCWITDGLAANSYADGEQSWIQSPCFNFTSLTQPYINASVFWETEFGYDGANLQYSINGGSNWQIAGSSGSSACLDAFLYNGAVRYLPYSDGWSGSTNGSCANGGGSGTWVTTKIYMPQLAGVNNVIFRFFFGAGIICNSFDGFAFDDFTILEAPPSVADFTYLCAGGNLINFTNLSSCSKTLSWNFGDPLSGINNTSTLPNPSHDFSGAGVFDVTLNATDQQNNTTTIVKKVSVISLSDGGTINATCNGFSNGSATVIVTGQPATYSYLWSTVPQQITATATNLVKGQYTVTVSSPVSCTVSKDFTVDEPAAIQINFTVQPSLCGNSNATVVADVSGGTMPYNLSWSPVAGNTTSLINIDSGQYSLNVTDNNFCTYTGNVLVNDISDFKISLGNDTTLCPGDAFTISPGKGFVNYLWQDGSFADSYTVNKEGLYWVNAKNTDGCSAADSIKIISDCGEIYFPSAFTPNGDYRNDFFGPLGNLAAIKNYSFIIYDRWGNIVFSTTNPFIKWDGYSKSRVKNNGATYVWFAHFDYREQINIQRKGTVVSFF